MIWSNVDRDDAQIWDCGGWSATRFWWVAMGDVNPPCVFAHVEVQNLTSHASLPEIGPNFVAFVTTDGHSIRATW